MEEEAMEETRVGANTAAAGTREKGAHVAIDMGVDEKRGRTVIVRMDVSFHS